MGENYILKVEILFATSFSSLVSACLLQFSTWRERRCEFGSSLIKGVLVSHEGNTVHFSHPFGPVLYATLSKLLKEITKWIVPFFHLNYQEREGNTKVPTSRIKKNHCALLLFDIFCNKESYILLVVFIKDKNASRLHSCNTPHPENRESISA